MTFELNIATTFEHVASIVPDRVAVMQGDYAITYSRLNERSRKLARFLADCGLSQVVPRESLSGHECGQSLFGQYLRNCPEFLEGMIGSFSARVAPFNINYRYGSEEIRYLLSDASPKVIQYHAEFAPILAEALGGLSESPILLQVADHSNHNLLPDAIDYEDALASREGDAAKLNPSPDDLYVLYTGGTTGMPKGVLWRQADVTVAAMGQFHGPAREEWKSLDDRESHILRGPYRTIVCPPLIHGAAQWNGLQALLNGDTMVLMAAVDHFDASEVCDTIERLKINSVSIVGDAFAGPILEELNKKPRDLTSLRMILSGGATLRPAFKSQFVELVPGLRVLDFIASSETGTQGQLERSARSDSKSFETTLNTVIVSEDLSKILRPEDGVDGWLARSGRVPLGYLGDKEKTARTFPVIDGTRYAVAGDRAQPISEDEFELLGRDSVTINTGGEKVFSEEVELAIKELSEVADVVVCGRPSERWGQEIVALVMVREGCEKDRTRITATCRSHLAPFKTPRVIIFVDQIVRSPSGKPDYRWALEQSLAQANSFRGRSE